MVGTDKKELSNKRIEKATKTVAEILNRLEGTIDEVRWACEDMKWDDGVALQMEDAAKSLGFALATLTNWFDADDADENGLIDYKHPIDLT